MGIVWCREVATSGGATASLAGAATGTKYSRQFHVLTDNMDDGPITVMAAADLPQPYEQYVSGTDSDTEAVAVSIRPRRHKQKPLLWEVDIAYAKIPGLDTGLGEITITSYTPNVRVSFAPRETAVEEAHLQEPTDDYAHAMASAVQEVLNSADRPYGNAIMRVENDIAVEIRRNEWYFNLNTAAAYKDALNDKPFWGRPRGEVRMVNIGGERKVIQSNLYYSVTYEFHIRPGGWGTEVLDAGTERFAKADGSRTSSPGQAEGWVWCTNIVGLPVTGPVALDGEGAQIIDPATTPVYWIWHCLEEADFDALLLPTPDSLNILTY